MRLFHIKIQPVTDWAWTLDSTTSDYHTRYAKEREQQPVLEAAQAASLGVHRIILHKNAPTVITERQMTGLVVDKIVFELIGEIATDEDDPTDLNGVMRKFNRMAAKLLSAPALKGSYDPPIHRAYNERCEVHMPGQALSTYNVVRLLENLCSDELQKSLDDGWRIIAACPQPDARRPDYILGKYDLTRDISRTSGYAARPE